MVMSYSIINVHSTYMYEGFEALTLVVVLKVQGRRSFRNGMSVLILVTLSNILFTPVSKNKSISRSNLLVFPCPYIISRDLKILSL